MAEIELVGEWSDNDASAVIAAIRKSLGVDDGGGAEATVEETIMPDLAEKNRKRLLELWRQAGSAAFPNLSKSAGVEESHECGPDCDHSWNDYGNLQKAVLGQLRRDPKGRTYRFNANSRWTRFEVGGSGGELPDPTQFTFPVIEGEFDRGVYFPVVGASSGYLRLKLRLDIDPGEIISDTEFYDLEDDMARNIGLLLDAKNVKAIAKAEGNKVTMLMVRDSDDIQVLGAIAGSGELPEGNYEYQLVSLDVKDDHVLCEVETAPVDESGLSLQKSLRTVKKLWSGNLSGMRAIPNGKPSLNRQLVRQAVANCDRCGVPVGDVKVRLTEGAPDWLSPDTYAFCLPTEDTVFLCNHDPREAIDRQVRRVTLQLMEAAAADAIDPHEAMEIVGRAASVTPCEWLESLIKHYTGAILCARVQCIMTETYPGVWHRYLSLLASRGLEYWGNRHSIAKCMAEDYRVINDPSGLPNQVTMLWDQANPAIARVCQQVLVTTLNVDADE